MHPQGTLSIAVHVTPTDTDVLPENPASMDFAGQTRGRTTRHMQRRVDEEGFQGR